jgi:oligosaccharide repeat unit polymerase
MGVYSAVIALFLGIIIILHELLRQKSKKVDILMGVNILYFICFTIVPILVQFSLINLEHVSFNNYTDTEFFYGSIYTFIGYILIIMSYYLFKKKYPLNKFSREEKIKGKKQYIILGSLISIFGLFCTALYTYSLGGISNVLESGTLYRSTADGGSSFAFVRNLALFTLTGSFIFFGFIISEKNKKYKFVFITIFILLFMTSLYLLFNRAGRLGLVSYLMMFPAGLAVFKNKIHLRTLLFGSLFAIFFILQGKRIFNYFVLSDFELKEKSNVFQSVIAEFAFPYINISKAVNIPFVHELPRYFIDLPIGLINLLPNRLLGIESFKTITQYNSEYHNGQIPVDIITLGYFSFGLAGIMIICVVFGYLIRRFEYFFSGNMNIIIVMFYVQWIEFLSFRVMYADFTNVIKGNIDLIISTIGFIFVYRRINNGKHMKNKV